MTKFQQKPFSSKKFGNNRKTPNFRKKFGVFLAGAERIELSTYGFGGGSKHGKTPVFSALFYSRHNYCHNTAEKIGANRKNRRDPRRWPWVIYYSASVSNPSAITMSKVHRTKPMLAYWSTSQSTSSIQSLLPGIGM